MSKALEEEVLNKEEQEVAQEEQVQEQQEQATAQEEATQDEGDTTNTQVDKDEMARIASNRAERAEKSALNSYLQQQGLTEDEAQQALEAYMQEKESKKLEDRNSLETMQTKHDTLESDFNKYKEVANKRLVRAETITQAVLMGFDPDKKDYMLRLADLKDVEIDEEGNPNTEQIKTSLEKLSGDFPDLLKGGKEEKGFKIGGPGDTHTEDVNDMIAKAFGNK